MKPGILCLLTGTIALAGCTSTASGGGAPTNSPKTTPVVTTDPTAASTAAATSDPRPSGTRIASAASSATPAPPVATVALGPAPKPADAYAAGRAAMKARNYSAAERDFRIAVAHNQNTAASAALLGVAASATGDYVTAYKGYTRASLLDPKNATLVYGAAYTALNSRNYHAAIDFAKQYIGMRPRDVRGYHVRFLAESHLLQSKQQLADARTIVSLQPNNAESYNELGIALGNGQKYAPSIAAFAKAIRMRPGYAPYYSNRAIIENLKGEPKLALADLQMAERNTTNPVMRRSLSTAIASLKARMGH